MRDREATDGLAFLEVEGVSKRFGACLAVDNVGFAARQGEFVCILGPSGCGKTTLLRIIAGLEEQEGGRIVMAGRDVSRLATGQRKCGIVFQSYALFPNLCAWRNVAYGMRGKGLSRNDVRARALEQLERVGLADAANRYPAQLSGGQQQRVALARALATGPELLLLDEPFSALDARVRVRLRQEVRDIQQQLGITTVMVTHDQEEALTLADRVIVMHEGRIVQSASPRDVYHAPETPFVADFIGAMNFLHTWELVRAGQVCRDGYALRLAKTNGSKPGDTVALAIRPEDIQLVSNGAFPENHLQGVVQSVEFRGPVYRVRVRLEDDKEGLELDVDAQADLLEGLGVQVGMPLPIALPPERLLAFHPGSQP